MKRIALITFSVAFPGEKGLARMYYLANRLHESGFFVELITTAFQHWEKRQRDKTRFEKQNAPFKITLIDEPGYTKNVQIKRIISHRVLAWNIINYLEKQEAYDLAYCMIPDNYLAARVGGYARAHGIPYVIDIEDLWPQAMRMVLDIPVISDMLFLYFTHYAKKAYRLCDAVIASSDTYRDEPLRYGIDIKNRTTVYAGNDAASFRAGVLKYRAEAARRDDRFRLTYAGTIGTSYDIKTLIRAADIVEKRKSGRLSVLILGDGPMRAECEALAASLSEPVTFAGFMPYEKMAAYLTESDAVINSLVRKASQSIVSKIGDYLCSGHPMINTCVDPEFCAKVEKDGFGINVEPGDPEILADAIISLMDDPETCAQMGRNALRIAEEQFDRALIYDKIVRVVSGLTGAEK